MTEAEKRIWFLLRKKRFLHAQWYRQKVFGHYIVDFYCPKWKLVLEIDGSQHFDGNGLRNDKTRTAFLEKSGLRIYRCDNRTALMEPEIFLEKVLQPIDSTPDPSLVHKGGVRSLP